MLTGEKNKMNLKSKKRLIARTMNVGLDRIIIKSPGEVKDAITRQDIHDLVQSGLVIIKNIHGTLKNKKRKTRKRQGSVRKVAKNRKRIYMMLTRKLRRHASNLKKLGKIKKEKYAEVRKKIKAKNFRSLSHLQDHLGAKD